MKYSALRNPHSTSCYGIPSDQFWVDILAASPVCRVRREGTSVFRASLHIYRYIHSGDLSISRVKSFTNLAREIAR